MSAARSTRRRTSFDHGASAARARLAASHSAADAASRNSSSVFADAARCLASRRDDTIAAVSPATRNVNEHSPATNRAAGAWLATASPPPPPSAMDPPDAHAAARPAARTYSATRSSYAFPRSRRALLKGAGLVFLSVTSSASSSASSARDAASAGANRAALPRRHRARGLSCTSATSDPTTRNVNSVAFVEGSRSIGSKGPNPPTARNASTPIDNAC